MSYELAAAEVVAEEGAEVVGGVALGLPSAALSIASVTEASDGAEIAEPLTLIVGVPLTPFLLA